MYLFCVIQFLTWFASSPILIEMCTLYPICRSCWAFCDEKSTTLSSNRLKSSLFAFTVFYSLLFTLYSVDICVFYVYVLSQSYSYHWICVCCIRPPYDIEYTLVLNPTHTRMHSSNVRQFYIVNAWAFRMLLFFVSHFEYCAFFYSVSLVSELNMHSLQRRVRTLILCRVLCMFVAARNAPSVCMSVLYWVNDNECVHRERTTQ